MWASVTLELDIPYIVTWQNKFIVGTAKASLQSVNNRSENCGKYISTSRRFSKPHRRLSKPHSTLNTAESPMYLSVFQSLDFDVHQLSMLWWHRFTRYVVSFRSSERSISAYIHTEWKVVMIQYCACIIKDSFVITCQLGKEHTSTRMIPPWLKPNFRSYSWILLYVLSQLEGKRIHKTVSTRHSHIDKMNLRLRCLASDRTYSW